MKFDKVATNKLIIIDADFVASERLERFVLEKEQTLKLTERITTVKVFTHHEAAYAYLAEHSESMGAYFVKVSTPAELLMLKKLQELKTQLFFMIYTDNAALSSELLSLTVAALWTHMTVASQQETEIKRMIEKVLKFVFTKQLTAVEINGFPIVVDSLLYLEADKKHRNYLHAVTDDNECLIRGTLVEVKRKIPKLLALGRGLLINSNKIRRIEADGLTLCFKGTTKRISAPKVCKKQLKDFVTNQSIRY